MKTNILIILIVAIIPFGAVQAVEKCDAPQYAKKESKHLQKQGWRPFSDDACIAEQLANRGKLQMEFDDDLFPKYIYADGISDMCLSIDEAYKKAIAVAQLALVSMSKTEINSRHQVMSASETMESTNSIGGYTFKTISIRNGVEIDTVTISYNGIKLMQSYQNGDEGGVNYNWDAMLRYSDVLPIAKNAWVALRLYRKTDKGYEVLVTLFNYSPKDLEN